MRVLLTDDDGFESEGIGAVRAAARLQRGSKPTGNRG